MTPALHDTDLPGVFRVESSLHTDARGSFAKLAQADVFAERGITIPAAEQFVTVSARHVIRGLHFQLPPHAHAKLVTCLAGEVLDVVVDLRRASPCFGQTISLHLRGSARDGVYIPVGCAHGFCALTDHAMLLYSTGTVHALSCDAGIRWDSAGIIWPVAAPSLSPRDAALPSIANFDNPF